MVKRWVTLGRRLHPKMGQYCMPIHTKLRNELLDTTKPFSKEYLQLLIKEVILKDGVATIRGGYRPLAGAIRWAAEKKNPTAANAVIGFNGEWRPRDDSNVRPTP